MYNLRRMLWLAIIVGAVIVVILWKLPQWQVQAVALDPKDRIDLEIKARAVVAQVVLGSLLALTAYATWRNIEIAQRSLEISRQNVDLARASFAVEQRARLTGRFASAVELLGTQDLPGLPGITKRLGGIYALEQIAVESETDYWPVMEVLTGFVRTRRQFALAEPLSDDYVTPADVQAALTVIARRKHHYGSGEAHSLNLAYADLRGAHMNGAHFEGTHFYGSDLRDSFLLGAYLNDATLNHANLNGVILLGADLSGADLSDANVTGALYSEHTKWPHGFDALGKGAQFFADKDARAAIGRPPE